MPGQIITIIDDEIDMTFLLKIELETAGYKVFVAHDGQAGLKLINDVKPDLILLDVMMPVMNGFEVLQVLQKTQETKDIPVLMFSAKGQEEDMKKGLEGGAVDYITKPFHSGLLLKRIELTLKK